MNHILYKRKSLEYVMSVCVIVPERSRITEIEYVLLLLSNRYNSCKDGGAVRHHDFEGRRNVSRSTYYYGLSSRLLVKE